MRRDLFKTISFAVLHFAVGLGVSYAFTGSLAVATGIALIEPLANTVVFYFHERAWNRYDGSGGGWRRRADRVSWQSVRALPAGHAERRWNYPGNCV